MGDYFQASAKDFIGRLVLGRKPKAQPAAPSLTEQFTESAPPRSVTEQAREKGEIWSQTRVVQFAVITNLLVAAALFGTVSVQKSRPPERFNFPGDLDEQVRNFYGGDGDTAEIRREDAAMFIITNLTLAHNISKEGNPLLGLLQPRVDAKLYGQISDQLARNKIAIESAGISQGLNIVSIQDLEESKQDKRVAATVTGFLSTRITKPKSGGKPECTEEPYRARVVLERVAPNAANNTGFLMVLPLKEVYGLRPTETFDKEMEALRARRTGKQ
jgi:hypothetical protein